MVYWTKSVSIYYFLIIRRLAFIQIIIRPENILQNLCYNIFGQHTKLPHYQTYAKMYSISCLFTRFFLYLEKFLWYGFLLRTKKTNTSNCTMFESYFWFYSSGGDWYIHRAAYELNANWYLSSLLKINRIQIQMVSAYFCIGTIGWRSEIRVLTHDKVTLTNVSNVLARGE